MLFATVLYLLSLVILIIMQVAFFVKKISIYRNLLYTALLIYINLVLGITIFPIPIQEIPAWNFPYYFVPFSSVVVEFHSGITSIIRNLLGNIIMFVPLGIMLPLLLRKRNLPRILLTATLATVSIELMQFLIGVLVGFHYRVVSVDDVILNLIGAVLGFFICKIIPRSIKSPYLLNSEPKPK